jgi:hypothetical protein
MWETRAGLLYAAFDIFLSRWSSLKTFVEYSTDVSHDVLHFLTGLGAWLLIAVLVRRPISSFLPLAITVALAFVNEAADLWFDVWPERARQLGELAKDLFTTLAVPLLLFLLARAYPALFAIPGRAGDRD